MGKQDQQPGLEKTHKTLGFLGYWGGPPPFVRVASLANQRNSGLNGNGHLWAKNERKHASSVSLTTPRVFPAIFWPKIARARQIEYRGVLFFLFICILAS
jgi:hypothetical protein